MCDFDEIVRWKDASGLLVGGDPDGVTPEMLGKFIQAQSRLLWDVRQHLISGGDRLAGEFLIARLNLFLNEDEPYV